MDTIIHVYEIEAHGAYRKVSPECGFDTEAAAHGHAHGCAASRRANCNSYFVVGGSEILAVYRGRGLQPDQRDTAERRVDHTEIGTEYWEASLAQVA